MVGFGQLAVGPPGAGKTTFIAGMQQLLNAMGRKCIVVNLDFANDEVPYNCTIDVRHLMTVGKTMDTFNLGPNGSLLWCMEYLEENFDWLETRMKAAGKDGVSYFLIDSPGQVELYTHHSSLRRILHRLVRILNLKLTAVHLTDSILCTEASHFISGLLVSLSGQLQLELPHVNLLSKVDLLRAHKEELAFQIEYYAQVQDLHQLLEAMSNKQFDHPFNKRFINLNAAIAETVEDFNLVGFLPLAVEDKALMLSALKQIDTANGFALSSYWEDPLELFKTSLGPAIDFVSEAFGSIQEKYIDGQPPDIVEP